MRYLFIAVSLLFVNLSLLNASSISEVLSAGNNERLEVIGVITGQVDDDEFLLQDATGELSIEVQKYTLANLGQSILNKQIKAIILVEKKSSDKSKYKAISISFSPAKTQ